MVLGFGQIRIAQPDDPASKHPINIPTQTLLTNIIYYEGIPNRSTSCSTRVRC